MRYSHTAARRRTNRRTRELRDMALGLTLGATGALGLILAAYLGIFGPLVPLPRPAPRVTLLETPYGALLRQSCEADARVASEGATFERAPQVYAASLAACLNAYRGMAL